jgi:uncharacterized protein (TIGR02284 family)
MNTSNDARLLDCLASLLQVCRAGERGFSRCAAQADAISLQWLLTQRAQQYRKAGAELEALLREAVGTTPPVLPDDGDTKLVWVVDRRLLAGLSDLALLVECERGEESTVRHYRLVLDEDLPIVLRAIAQRHCDAAKGQRAQLRSVRATMLAAVTKDQTPASAEVRQGDAQPA